MPQLDHGVTVRVYVDDITVSAIAPTAWGVVRALGFALPRLRDTLGKQGVVLSQPKEQFFSPTVDVINLWNQLHPGYSGHKGKTAKDLGASLRGIGRKSTMRGPRMTEASHKAKRIRTLATGRRANILITRASLQAGAFYACELDPLTQREFTALRAATASAINCQSGPNNNIATMLFESKGIFEPKALYTYRLLCNWHRQTTLGVGPTTQISAYWKAAHQATERQARITRAMKKHTSRRRKIRGV